FDWYARVKAVKRGSIVHQSTRECIGGLVERSITADRFIVQLEELIVQRGAPVVLRSDNGPEFISQAVTNWAANRTALSYIPPGQPWHNGYVESFNARACATNA